MKRRRIGTRVLYISLLLASICVLAGTFLHERSSANPDTVQDDMIVVNELPDKDTESSEDVKMQPEDMKEEIIAELVCKRLQAVDFTIKEYPINEELYTEEMDREYKEVFKQVLLNQIPIQYEYGEEAYFIEIWPESKRDYYEDIKEDLLFYYLDFDGDGLPELIIKSPGDVSFGGPRILKYNADNSKVYNFGERWRFPKLELLCSGKLYYEDRTGAGGIRYEYQEIDSMGKIVIDVNFFHWYNLKEDSSCYEVSIGEFEQVEIDKESWDNVTKDFFEAKDNAVKGITYDELFSDMEYP